MPYMMYTSLRYDRYVIILILFSISRNLVGFAISDGNVRNVKMIPNIERFVASVSSLLQFRSPIYPLALDTISIHFEAITNFTF